VIIPIDFNENGKIDPVEKIYNTLDDVLKYAEQTKAKNYFPKTFMQSSARTLDKKLMNFYNGYLQKDSNTIMSMDF